MKRYAAKHHVGLGDYTARPGEIIDRELTEEEAQWLLSQNAIEPLPDFYTEAPDMGDGQQEQEEAEPENLGDGQQEQEEAEPENLGDGQQEQEEEQEEQPPEIDAMDGITAENAPEEPKKKGGKRK